MEVVRPAGSPDAYITDPERLDALAASGLLSADVDPALDRWTRLASTLIGAPLALLSLVDRDRQYFKSQVGLPADVARERETPLSHSFCQHVVAGRQPFVVSDAHDHPLVRDNGAIADLGVVAYAGQPITTSDGHTLGSFCVIDDTPREWTAAELTLLEDLTAGLLAEIELRAALRSAVDLQADLSRQSRVDALTGLLNRRQLMDDLDAAVAGEGETVLAMFDLDGFKTYNDTFGHPAGDGLLKRLSGRLADVVAEHGGHAYRLGGDEFCVLIPDATGVAAASGSLREHGEGFDITSSHGSVVLDATVASAEQAMNAADQRLYGNKHSRSGATQQAQAVLLGVLREREPDLDQHVRQVSLLARAVCRRLGLETKLTDEIALAAQMHDIGKVAVPDSILDKPGPLDEEEWAIMRRHTLFGERILSTAPALRAVAGIVRSSHERWDGAGYPDGLAAEAIPLGARIILACDAFDAMTSARPYGSTRTAREAIEQLRACSHRQFDAAIVEALIAVIGDEPWAEGRPAPPRNAESPTRCGAFRSSG